MWISQRLAMACRGRGIPPLPLLLLLTLLLLLPPATPNYCGPGACYWYSGSGNARVQECGRTSDPNSRHTTNGYIHCYRCLAGRYQPSSANKDGGCIACGVGRYSSSSTGASSCTDRCATGRYSSDSSSSCIDCGAGWYSSTTGETSASSCIACGVGWYSSSPGASGCIACRTGWYSSTTGASSCIDCGAGRYSSSTSSISCIACGAGRYSRRIGASGCIACGAGRYSNTTGETSWRSCIACGVGRYSSSTSSISCIACGVGRYSSSSTRASSCTDRCTAGRYSSDSSSSCIGCGAGRYSNTTGETSASSCIACGVGRYSRRIGASGCFACGVGRYSSSTSSISCIACGAGRYSSSSTGASSCTDRCPAGRYSSDSSSSCIGCGAGRYSSATGETSASSCIACGAGRYSSSPGATRCEWCLFSSEGRYSSSSTGASSCTDRCPAGRYSSDSSSSCIGCGVGRYSSSTSSISCIACGAGRYSSSSTGASSCTDRCPAGRYSSDSSSSCIGCGAGRYSSATGETSASSCIACGAGRYSSSPGATRCEWCLFSSEGRYSSSSTGASSCTDRCPAGRYSSEREDSCIACEAGRYSNTTGEREWSCTESWYLCRGESPRENSCIGCGILQTSDPGASECHANYWLFVLGVVVCASPCGYLLVLRTRRPSAQAVPAKGPGEGFADRVPLDPAGEVGVPPDPGSPYGVLSAPRAADAQYNRQAKEETEQEEDNTPEQKTKVAKRAAIFQLDGASEHPILPRQSVRHVMLDREIARVTFNAMKLQLEETQMLDLTGPDYARLSDAGLGELIQIPGLCDSLEALFTDPGNAQVTEEAVLRLQATCGRCKCVSLGREISMASFVQLRSQASGTKRVDLTSAEYARVTAKGLRELGALFPELVAVFTSPRAISVEDLELIRPSLPTVRCLELGREVSADAYADIERQLDETRMLDLTSAEFSTLSDRGLAEIVYIPGLCNNLEALFTRTVSAEALHKIKPQCSWAQCVLLGREIDAETFQALRVGFRERRVVDLSGSKFDRLTEEGLREIVAMCPDVAALAPAAKQVSSELNGFLLDEISRLVSTGATAPSAPALDLPYRGKAMDEQSLSTAHQHAGVLKAALDAKFPMRFNLQEILGAGGSGLVIKARDKQLGAVAIKVVKPQVNGVTFTEKEHTRLEREVATMRRATHPNVCTCHEFFFSEDNKMCVMVLEYLNGESLEEMVASRGDSLQEIEVLRIMADCLEALKMIHGAQLVHRDLKPSNIVGHTHYDGGVSFKIIDFGIAMASDDDEGATVATAMKTGGVRGIGTLHYMSREQYSGDHVTKLTDIYSLGVTMFFALTAGRLPFAHGETKATKVMFAVCGPAEAPSVHASASVPIGDKVAELVARALRKEPDERFQSAEDMLVAVADAMTRRGYSKYDAMISYRNQSEAAFARGLYEQMSRTQVALANGKTRRMRVFLDQERLEAGERWDIGAIHTGVAASTVVLPLISAGAIAGLAKLAVEDKIDWLLVEWEVALALEAAGRVGKVYPILLGKQGSDGTRTDFFDDGSDCADAAPDRPSALTSAETANFLRQIDADLAAQPRSVRGTLVTLLRYQAFNLGTCSGVHGGANGDDGLKLHNEAAVAAAVEAVVPVVSAAVQEAAAQATLRLAAVEPEPEPEPQSRVGTAGGAMTMKDVVGAIKHEIGLEGKMSPKEVIAAAAEQYGVEVGKGSLKEQVKRVAAELDIDTGW